MKFITNLAPLTFNLSKEPYNLWYQKIFGKEYRDIDFSSNIFEYLSQTIFSSALMRSFMQAKIISKYKHDSYNIIVSSSWTVKNSIVIIDRMAINNEKLLSTLKKNQNIILIDVIDGVFDLNLLHYVDGIICCSHKAYNYYNTLSNRCMIFFIEHCADIRLPDKIEPLFSFSPYYFGAHENLLMYNSLRDLLTIVYTDHNSKITLNWMDKIPLANFHYALRPPMEKLVFKPFTKGFTAAWANSNILVHKDDGDAALYLGNDYPYLIHEDITESVVLEYLAKATDDFGSKDWNYALSIMKEIKEKISHENIAKQFWAMIKDIS
ncbi:hypothetical protein [Desulfovibrio litoralis]|uniref:hypothetical protein n=1 Tax=Desulfovibrio litoralis TaxID=466107 RepID=UPI0011604C45|nr:hypothetical protein [Desulfovibrio litoralis]